MEDIKKEIPLVLIVKIGYEDPSYTNGDNLKKNIYEHYSSNVRIETMKTVLNSSCYFSGFEKDVLFPAKRRDDLNIKYVLRQVVFQIENIRHYHLIAVSIMHCIIDVINSECIKNDSYFRAQPWLDNIRDNIPEDGNIAICATKPIGGCWYWDDEYSLRDYPLYSNSKQSYNKNSLYWIAVNTSESKPYIELYYDQRTVYYGVRLSRPMFERYEGEFKSIVMYEYQANKSCAIGKIIDIEADYAIIHFDDYPGKYYASYSSFIEDIVDCILYRRFYAISSTNVRPESVIKIVTNKNREIYYGKDSTVMNSKQEKDIRIEEAYNTLSSITKDLSGIYDKLQEVSSKYFAILNDNNLLSDSKDTTKETTKTDTKLILIVTDQDLTDEMNLKTASILDEYKFNIFGWLRDDGNVSRIFVNSDTIYDTKLNSMKFEAIVFVWDDNKSVPDALYDRAFELDANGVHSSTSSYDDSERYEFKCYYGNLSYTDKTYKVTKKG